MGLQVQVIELPGDLESFQVTDSTTIMLDLLSKVKLDRYKVLPPPLRSCP